VQETLWQRLVRGTRRLRQLADWSSFAGPEWADRIMAVPVTDRFHAKQGRTIGRWVLDADGRRLVVYLKRHYRLPRWRGLLATLRPERGWSPALEEWDHLTWARDQGLPVPTAVAGGEYIGPWGRLQSFLVVEELTGMLPLHEAVPAAAARLDPRAFILWKRGLAAEMARLCRALHDRRRFHKDLYFCHFYIAEEDTRQPPPGWRGRVQLIDLHRLRRHHWTWPWWQAKDLSQILYSSAVVGVTARDRLWFARAYLGGAWSRRAPWWLRGVVRLKAWGYRRHNRKHPGTKNVGVPPPGDQVTA
jgi:heptose I phosphotransferase